MDNCVYIATQMICYSNDSVDVSYSDGSHLQLSACGTAFVHDQAPATDVHQLYGVKRIQQRTQFATSEFRAKVKEAIVFRNMFAERPFLCVELLQENNILNMHADIQTVKWAKSVTDIKTVKQDGQGGLTIYSEDDYASLTLAASQQEFTVNFLAKVKSHEVKQVLQDIKNSYRSVQSSKSTNTMLLKEETLDSVLYHYVWQTQHFSVARCPDNWTHPLRLAQHILTNPAILPQCTISESMDIQTSQCPTEQVERIIKKMKKCHSESRCFVETILPESLPLKCDATHLHKWQLTHSPPSDHTEVFVHSRPKVILSAGILYRLLRHPRYSVEVYPGDMSVIISQNATGHFFTHYIPSGKKIVEKVYSVSNPPPDSVHCSYSIAKLITRGGRFLMNLTREEMSLGKSNSQVCWNWKSLNHQPVPVPVSLLEECTVDGLGQFSAFTSGRVRVVFWDRTSIEMVADFTARISRCQKHSPDKLATGTFQVITPKDLIVGHCKILSPNGQYKMVSEHEPGQFKRYVDIALEWIAWVNTSPEERGSFYQDTIYDAHKTMSIQKELDKIKCFSYIVDNTIFGKSQPNEGAYVETREMMSDSAGPLCLDFVQRALQTTSRTIQDIDDLLQYK